jgi:mRNA interferase RelE/StbE
MNCKIILTIEAQRNLKSIDNIVIREQIIERIDVLGQNPEIGKTLRGILSGFRSLRAVRNRYRIIYKFSRTEKLVTVIAIGIRKSKDFDDVYKALERIIKGGKSN